MATHGQLVYFVWGASWAAGWALDTGAAYDIANEKVPGRRSQVAVCDRIWTAGGVVTSNETVYRDDVIPGEAINARVLPNTPNALKVGARCVVEGYGFFWHPFTRKPVFMAPNGKIIECDVDENYIPCLLYTSPSPRDRG